VKFLAVSVLLKSGLPPQQALKPLPLQQAPQPHPPPAQRQTLQLLL